MKCPRCNTEHTRLSWLRELSVVYWCTNCHSDFEIARHRKSFGPSAKPEADGAAASNGAH